MRNMNYWEQLNELKMISVQRRQERYRCLYIWKILEGMVPNCGVSIVNGTEDRVGGKVRVPRLNRMLPVSVKRTFTYKSNYLGKSNYI